MQPPNLQAILIDYVDVAWRAVEDGDTNYEALNKAIDAIYAGLLAEVIGPDDETIPLSANTALWQDSVNGMRNEQRQALKRWCYGETK